MNFNGHCLIKNDISIPKKLINLYIFYTLCPQLEDPNTDFSLGNCLFGSAKLTENAYLDKYKYAGYGIGFDSRSEFLFTDGSYGKNIIIFGAMWAHLCMLIIKEKISSFLVKDQCKNYIIRH